MTDRKRPDLQELVARFGSYSAITPEAWAQWDRDVEAWKAWIRSGERYYRDQANETQSSDQGGD